MMSSTGESQGFKRLLSSSSQDSVMESSGEKHIRLDPARLAYEKELRRQATVLVDLRNQVTKLQAKLQAAEKKERESQLIIETEREELRRRTEQAESRVSWLKGDLERERVERAELSAQVTEAQSQMRATKLAAERSALAEQKRATQRTQNMAEELAAAREQLEIARREQLAAETARQLAEHELAAARLAASQRPASDGGLQLSETNLELQTAHSRVKELENQLESASEDARLSSLLRERLAEFPHLQEKNRAMADELKSLRQMVDRTLILEEQATVAQKKALRFDELQQQLETLRAEWTESRGQLEEWRRAAGEDCGSAGELGLVVASLRKQQLLAHEDAGTARAEVSAAEGRCARLQTELNRLQSAEKEHQQTTLESQVQLRKLQRKLTLVTMERDSCKRVLEAYEAETTTSLTTIELQRAEDRDKQLAACRQQLETLERQLQLAASSGKLVMGSEDPEAVQQLRGQLQQLQQQHEQLQLEKEGLEAQLEERALRGDYNPATSRVLTLKDNPASAATSKRAGLLERLQAENAELRARVGVLSSASTSGGLSQETAKQISALRSQVHTSQLRMRRLKEVFGRSTQEFRQAVSQLTGYKVNIDGQQIKLRNVYAPRSDQTLLFQWDGADTIQLLETSFSANLSDLVGEYLFRQDSMPGFLGALTLRLLKDGPSSSAPTSSPSRAAPPPAADDDDCEIVELD